MLRAAQLAARRRLELRVVSLPGGWDPAELIQREGPEGIAAAVEEAVPFVRFRVERVLAAGDHGSPEGRDRMVDELRPVFATLPPSAMRMELTRLVAGRLELPESLTERPLSAPASASGAAGARSEDRAGDATARSDARSPDRSGARSPRGEGDAMGPPPGGRGLERRSQWGSWRGVQRPSGRSWRCASPPRRRASRRFRSSTPRSTSPASGCAARGAPARGAWPSRWQLSRRRIQS